MDQGAIFRLSMAVGEHDHVEGPGTAPVTLLEYGDFECPYCRAAVPIVDSLRALLGDELRFVFRHFPLIDLHPHAEHAAEAAESAGAQGKFFAMHKLLFDHQQELEDDRLVQYAAELDVDVDRFRQDLATHAYATRVREDFRSGVDSGVRGTPTFYLDDIRFDSVVGLRQFVAAIRQAHPDMTQEELDEGAVSRAIPRVVRQRSPYQRHAR